MYLFSVILTTYNSGKSIQRLINSINNQVGKGVQFEIEWIVIDDCSTDNTTEILTRNNVKYLSAEKNSGGPNRGRNIGLKSATGDFICIVDHDDEWNSNKLAVMLPFLNIAPIVTSGYTNCDDTNGKIKIRVNKNLNNKHTISYNKNQTFINKLSKSKKGQITYLGSIVYNKELKNILFEEKIGQTDFDWLLALFFNQESIEITDSLYLRHISGGNLSLKENYRIKDYESSIEVLNKYKSTFPKEAELGRKRLNGSLARYYYLINNMPLARKYFLKSEFNILTILYFLTTFVGSNYIKRKFEVFG